MGGLKIAQSETLLKESHAAASTTRAFALKFGREKLWDHLRRLSKPVFAETQPEPEPIKLEAEIQAQLTSLHQQLVAIQQRQDDVEARLSLFPSAGAKS